MQQEHEKRCEIKKSNKMGRIHNVTEKRALEKKKLFHRCEFVKITLRLCVCMCSVHVCVFVCVCVCVLKEERGGSVCQT